MRDAGSWSIVLRRGSKWIPFLYALIYLTAPAGRYYPLRDVPPAVIPQKIMIFRGPRICRRA